MEFIKDFTRKVTDTAKVAAKKSSDMVEITKLNFNIGSEEDKIKKTYTQIGEIVYHSYEKGEEIPQDLKELCEKVVATKKSIEKMRQQILSLKNIKICPTCKEELPEEVAFCPKCGTKQEVVVPVVQEEKAEDNVENNAESDAQINVENSAENNAENNVEIIEVNDAENIDNEYQVEEDVEK
ncbi:zinc ribbon domain-containing protein [Acetivibrio mesophilus]|uniref:Zinc-ribbon domain-containing protein n=1 Tax=Acetivibrio mesophilus TaxID=2487273 RepID=A0A4Q0I4U8_9FIRM|nr:zinc ribbon domain-containing protein [Acetivibrio mesophilus]ODM26827.1 hypothetical protein A7W90_11730 [Clostridium sp. Bc-iso-3]RXE59308.1 zinc-ribbon domain-containing protein [Acetivibrio mesophilus]HHV28382.1 zinc-ribbon domain-containing protein [Clostridium sp.]